MKLDLAKRLTSREKLRASQIYCITTETSEIRLEEAVELACKGGADIIQYREKKRTSKDMLSISKSLSRICHDYNVLFIVNDRLDIALASGADGVHLGQNDIPIPEARLVSESISVQGEYKSPTNFIIGQSTHSLSQALQAQELGADYIGCGPIFSTPTKPGVPSVGIKLIQEYREKITIPFVAIGGIDENNIGAVLDAGAQCAAVVRAAFVSSNIETSVRSLKSRFN